MGYACNKPSTIGADILPAGDIIGLSFTDSIAPLSSTFRGDSVKVYGPSASEQLSFFLCGELQDPVFGTSSSEMYVQFGLTAKPILEDPVIEEIVLSLAFANSGHSGQMDLPQSYEVYRILDTLSVIDTLYSNSVFQTSMNPVGELMGFVPNVTDSVLVDSSLLSPQIRIPLDTELGQELLDSLASPYFLGLTDEFTAFFNGLNLRPVTGNTAMVRFSLSSIYSEVTMFYRDSSGMAEERESVAFAVKSTSVKSVRFEHDHNLGTIANYLDETAPNPQDFTFIQSMEGLGAKIEFPELEDWEDVIINRAELIITAAEDEDIELYPLPTRLGAFRKDDDGNLVSITDVGIAISNSNLSLFGGDQSFDFVDGRKVVYYKMFISAYLQNVIDDRFTDKALYLIPFDRGETANRVVLGGSGSDRYPMKLNLTYTKL